MNKVYIVLASWDDSSSSADYIIVNVCKDKETAIEVLKTRLKEDLNWISESAFCDDTDVEFVQQENDSYFLRYKDYSANGWIVEKIVT